MGAKPAIVAVFGSTRIPVNGKYQAMVFDELDRFERPFVIVTSTCRGMDQIGRRYAEVNAGVGKLTFKINKEKPHDESVSECNDWMNAVADIGVTHKGVKTKGSLDMLEKMKCDGKRIIFI